MHTTGIIEVRLQNQGIPGDTGGWWSLGGHGGYLVDPPGDREDVVRRGGGSRAEVDDACVAD